MTRYIGTAPDAVSWDFSAITGHAFETLIARHLQALYSYDRNAIQVEQTPPVRDHGRDVIIRTRVDLTLFGIAIRARPRRPTRIYVECKLRTGDRLEPEFFFDFAQFADGEGPPDHYFLVTTAALSPNVHFKAIKECREKKAEFHLIDRALLANYAARHGLALGNPASAPLPDDVVVECQGEPSRYQKNKELDIYLIIRNYSPRPRSLNVYLRTNDAWRISDGPTEISRIAEPLEALPFRLGATRLNPKEDAGDLELGLEVDDDRRTILVSAPDAHFVFVPRLFGDQHLDAVDRIWHAVDKSSSASFFSITGQAGVGKSRVVQDALEKRLHIGNIDLVRIFFEATDSPQEVLAALTALALPPPAEPSTTASCLAHLLATAAVTERNRVILLEDLHHASKEVIGVIKHYVLGRRPSEFPLMVIFTGRNDHTFFNEEYLSLLQVVRLEPGGGHELELLPLAPHKTRALIRSTVRDAPITVVRRIEALSENVPFHVIQAIEYLLEMGVAKLVSRSEVGIPRLERFSAKDYIPETVERLYELRLEGLRRLPDGQAMIDFLVTQSFFGIVVSPLVMREALDTDAASEILRTLVERRFLATQIEGTLTFAHENLLAFLRSWARRPANRARSAQLVLSRPQLLATLNDLDQGEVFFLAAAFERGVVSFARLLRAVESITNFSSAQLDVVFFRYIDAAFECQIVANPEPELLRSVVLAKAYMGIHNYPLLVGTAACDSALEQLQRIELPEEERDVTRLEIRQLKAHGLLNMGRTREAMGVMLELDQLVRANPGLARPELLFDLYDRLQELYKKLNHESVAHGFGQLARRVAESAKNDQLLACHSITEAGMYVYRDPRRARELARWSHTLCKEHGAYRLRVYTKLSEYVTRALSDRNRATWSAILPKASELLREAIVNNLSDSLMRARLLVATLTYLTSPQDSSALETAERNCRQGIDNSVKFGNGLYSWLFYNLLGVLSDLRGAKRQVISELFNSAVRELDRQSLLFVGRRDFTYPNIFVISNAVAFYASINHEDALELMARVKDYESDFNIEDMAESRRQSLRLPRSRRRLFFEPTHSFACLSERRLSYWLPIL